MSAEVVGGDYSNALHSKKNKNYVNACCSLDAHASHALYCNPPSVSITQRNVNNTFSSKTLFCFLENIKHSKFLPWLSIREAAWMILTSYKLSVTLAQDIPSHKRVRLSQMQLIQTRKSKDATWKWILIVLHNLHISNDRCTLMYSWESTLVII